MVYKLKTIFIMILLSLPFLILGLTFKEQGFFLYTLLFIAVLSFCFYFFTDKLILKFYKLKILNDKKYLYLDQNIKKISGIIGVTTPNLCIIDEKSPNVFTLGRNQSNSKIYLTTGLIEILEDKELNAIFAHELSHIKNNDVLYSSIVAVLAHFSLFLFYLSKKLQSKKNISNSNILSSFLFILFAPFSAFIISFFISREREFLIDDKAKSLGFARDLANALKKISIHSNPCDNFVKPEFAHLFINNSLSNKGLLKLFKVHPEINERINRLLS